MRLIDADSLGIGKAKRSVFIEKAYADGWNSAIELINQAETVDAAPVVHGRWIEYPRAHYFKCSNCKYTVPHRKANLVNGKREYNYCPHCGAKMDWEEQNNA